MGAANKIDKQIHEYLDLLNNKQKKAVLTVVKTFVDEQAYDIWEDATFMAELDRRTALYESGKAKVLTLDELEASTKVAYQKGSRKG